jgi:hypothetical protein
MNTVGTIVRVCMLLSTLVLAWFLVFLSAYIVIVTALGLSFHWNYAFAGFGAFVFARMFYPRNVFAR